MNQLPEEIAYLQAALDDLQGTPAAELDECFDTAAICSALKGRVSGLADGEAITRLHSDRHALGAWLEANPESHGHFLFAFMEEAEPLVTHLRSFKPGPRRRLKKARETPRRLTMDVPSGFSSRREGTGFFMQCGSNTIGAGTVERRMLKKVLKLMQNELGVRLEAVEFGNHRGHRVLREEVARSYFLVIDDKDVSVSFTGDPDLVERHLASLRFE